MKIFNPDDFQWKIGLKPAIGFRNLTWPMSDCVLVR